MNPDIIEKANIIVNESDAAYIGVIDENGFPSVSTVSRIKSDGIYCSWFATGMSVNKTKRLMNNKAMVNVPLLFAVRTKATFILDNAVKCHANNFMIILVMLNTEISRVVQG